MPDKRRGLVQGALDMPIRKTLAPEEKPLLPIP